MRSLHDHQFMSLHRFGLKIAVQASYKGSIRLSYKTCTQSLIISWVFEFSAHAWPDYFEHNSSVQLGLYAVGLCWGYAVVFDRYSSFLHHLQLASLDLPKIREKSFSNIGGMNKS